MAGQMEGFHRIPTLERELRRVIYPDVILWLVLPLEFRPCHQFIMFTLCSLGTYIAIFRYPGLNRMAHPIIVYAA